LTGSTDVELVVVRDAKAAAAAAAALLVESARLNGSIVLAGGATPRLAYLQAAALLPDWGGAELWFGDDRCVPAEDARSNQRLVRESLLDLLAVRPSVHAIPTELPPDEAAAAYDMALRGRRLDLGLLGLGPDGHTASLFPDSPALNERERLAVAAAPGLEPWVTRVTLTVPALAAARQIVFLAVGAAKAEAARAAFAAEPSRRTPASLVRSRAGTTTAILDEAAAALLP